MAETTQNMDVMVITSSTLTDADGNITDIGAEGDSRFEIKSGMCLNTNGSFKEEDCVKYLQNQIQKMTLNENLLERKLTDFLTKLNLSLCLVQFELVKFNPKTQLCCNGILNGTASYDRCCNGTVIDIRMQLCCNDQVYEREENNGCCGTFVYDKEKQFCCGGRLHNISGDAGCCGTSAYNRRDQACCHGNVEESFENRNETENCCNSTNSKGECYSCENGKQLMEFFEDSKEICCNGKVRQKTYESASGCCSDTVFNVRTQVCRNGKIHANVRGSVEIKSQGSSEREKLSTTASMKHDISTFTIEGAVLGVTSVVLVGGTCAIIIYLKKVKKRKISNGKYNNQTATANDKCPRNKRQESIVLMHRNTRFETCSSSVTQALHNHLTNERNKVIHGDESEDVELTSFSRRVKNCNLYENARLIQERHTPFGNESVDDASVDNDQDRLLVFESSVSFNDLAKTDFITKVNLQKEQFVESQTQTLAPQNPTIKRNIFGEQFDHTYMLDETNPTLQMPDSAVLMTLPQDLVKSRKVEVSASTFRNIEALNDKLYLPEDQRLASPVVEYFLNGVENLEGYARIQIPFNGKADDLIVNTFESDEGLGTKATSTRIPRRDQENVSLDRFYIVEGQTVVIYTKSFSGYYCSKCKHKRDEDLELLVLVFGSYNRPIQRYEVFFNVYIADELFIFPDFKQKMIGQEENRKYLEEARLRMPDCDLNEKDYVEASLTVLSGSEKWMHVVHPTEGVPIYDEKESIEIGTFAQKCRMCSGIHTHDSARPARKQWYLCNKENNVPSDTFQCIINLYVCKKGSTTRQRNPITIDNLKLEADNYVKKDVEAVQETRYKSGDGPVGQRTRTTRDVIDDMQNTGRQAQTLVRAESEANMSFESVHRNEPPSPELSRVHDTIGPEALPYTTAP